MMHVTVKTPLLVLVCSLIILPSCKEPDVQIGSLGKKLAAPVLQGPSPFDQDFSGQTYVRIQGTCDSRVGAILFSFDNNNWHQPPATPNLTSTSLPAATSNDTDCADGSFDVYLSEADLINTWGISPESNVNAMYIKGSTVIGDTEILTIIDSKGPNGGGSSEPTIVKLEKSWPRGFAGSNQCQSFQVYLQNNNGYRSPYGSDVTFQIEMSDTVAGGTSSVITAYESWSDCSEGLNSTNTFSIPANQVSKEIVYKFPSSPIDGVLNFKIRNPSALTADSIPTAVTLRNSEDTTLRWLALENRFFKAYKDTCYPLNVRAYNYWNSWSSTTAGKSLNVSSSDTRVQFFSDSTCGGPRLTSFSFPTSGDTSLASGYFRYQSDGTEAGQLIPFSISFQGATSSYDSLPFEFSADTSGGLTSTKVDIWGPQNIDYGSCTKFQIISMNTNGTIVPASSAFVTDLSTAESNIGSFYSSPDCLAGYEITTTNFAAGDLSKIIYFKSLTPTSGLYHFNISAQNMTGSTREFSLNSNEFNLSLSQMTTGICNQFIVNLNNSSGFNVPAPINLALTATLSWSDLGTGDSTIYSDSTCQTASPTLTISQSAFSGYFYIKSPTATPNTATITVNYNNNGSNLNIRGLSGASFPW